MSAFREANIIGKTTQVVMPENPEAAPITDYGIYLDSVHEMEDEFRQLQEARTKYEPEGSDPADSGTR